MKNKAIKLAVPLLLIPSLIVSCGLRNDSNNPNNSPENTENIYSVNQSSENNERHNQANENSDDSGTPPQNIDIVESNNSNDEETPAATNLENATGNNWSWLQPVLLTLLALLGFIAVMLLLHALNSLDKKNKKLANRLSKLDNDLKELKQKGDSQNSQNQEQIRGLDRQINNLNGIYSTKLSELQGQIRTIKSQNYQNYPHIGEARNISQAQSGYGINMEPSYQPRKIEDPEDIKLLKNYYNNPQSLLSTAIRVRMTPETVNKILDGTLENKIELDQHRTGEYFVVSGDSGQQYLLLDPEAIFNLQTLQQIKKSRLFNCFDDLSQRVKGKKIQIKQLAKVREDGQIWYLIESGEIKLP